MTSDRRANRVLSGNNGIQSNLWWECSQPLEINVKGNYYSESAKQL